MKNILFLLLLAALTVSFNACQNNDNSSAWKEANTNAYNEITKNPDYSEIQTETGPTGVYKKVISSGTGTEHPFQTSEVKILYKGTYYDGTTFDVGSSQSNAPIEFASVAQTVRGFSFALQQMVVGDHWEIWIPYYLGYGANDYYDPTTYQLVAKGYTTLVFDVQLVSITLYP